MESQSDMPSPPKNLEDPPDAPYAPLQKAFELAHDTLAGIRKNPLIRWLVKGSDLKRVDMLQKQAAKSENRGKSAKTNAQWKAAAEAAVKLLKSCRDHPVGRPLVKGQILRQCEAWIKEAAKVQARQASKITAGAQSLFEAAWYLQKNPEVATTGTDPWTHYLDVGWKEGRKPNRFFDSAWYLGENPEVASAGQNPLIHYFETGAAKGISPGPRFDGKKYLEYHQDVKSNPLAHYLQFGEKEGRSIFPSGVHYYLDLPREGETIFDHLEVGGWVFTEKPQNLRVRVRLPNTDTWTEIQYGNPRPDVYQHNTKCPHANVGFSEHFYPKIIPGKSRITVEFFNDTETVLTITRNLVCTVLSDQLFTMHARAQRSFANTEINGERAIFGCHHLS